MTQETYQRNNKGQFVKGSHYNIGNKHFLGRHHTEEAKQKMKLAVKKADKSPYWKGDDASYGQLHLWVRRHFPKPMLCEECSKEKSWLDLANITGVYDRDINNYRYLCRKCHMKYDFYIGVR